MFTTPAPPAPFRLSEIRGASAFGLFTPPAPPGTFRLSEIRGATPARRSDRPPALRAGSDRPLQILDVYPGARRNPAAVQIKAKRKRSFAPAPRAGGLVAK